MTDMLKSIEPKSDQLNYDSFVGGVTRIIKITKIVGTEGDQPIAVHYEGENGRPYKPCKSMRRAMVMIWGDNGSSYVGKSMILYGDPEVMFGGVKVGGIRISHMSGLTEPMILALTNKKGSKKQFTVRPLVDEDSDLKKMGHIVAAAGMEALKKWWGEIGAVKQKALGSALLDVLKGEAVKADEATKGMPLEPNPPPKNP